MLEGQNVNLRVIDRSDIQIYHQWMNSREILGKYNPWRQISSDLLGNLFKNLSKDIQLFIIEKKDKRRIGAISHFTVKAPPYELLEIGYFLIPKERKKGFCTEAVKILLDYIFLSKNVPRVQATSDVQNIASQKVLEKAGFIKEGIIRCLMFNRGEWRDFTLYGILRSEWKTPKILKE